MSAARVRYNILAKTLKDTFLLLAYSLKYIRGKDVVIGPFDDKILPRTYVFIKGKKEDVEEVIESLKKEIELVAIPYVVRTRD